MTYPNFVYFFKFSEFGKKVQKIIICLTHSARVLRKMSLSIPCANRVQNYKETEKELLHLFRFVFHIFPFRTQKPKKDNMLLIHTDSTALSVHLDK